MQESPTDGVGSQFERFVGLIARLRGPGGCPWDREQTHESLKPMTLEEAYEVIEAIDDGDEQLAGELGDLLLQVVFHSQIAQDENRFEIGDVIEGVSEKMVRRHPHVFGDAQADTSDAVLRSWEEIKKAERGAADESMLTSVSKGQPAVMEAFQLATKTARVGFDWPDVSGALAKLQEELGELRDALGRTAPGDRTRSEELGDLLFSAVNVARLAGIDPESALKSTNRKFRRRFSYIETQLRRTGRVPASENAPEMHVLWEAAKALESNDGTETRQGDSDE
jgi:tetrapyrrole methylase family protein/MazG family protein